MENQIKLSVTDTKYFINPTKHSITCKMQYVVRYPLGVEPIIDYCSAILGQNNMDPSTNEVVVTARLHPNDSWDEKVGMSVARAKAESAAYKRVRKMLQRVMNHIYDTVVSPSYAFSNKAKGVEKHNVEYISKF